MAKTKKLEKKVATKKLPDPEVPKEAPKAVKQSRLAPVDWSQVQKLNNQIIDVESDIQDDWDEIHTLQTKKRDLFKQRKKLLGDDKKED